MADELIQPEPGMQIGLALSGGGFRATLFHLGVIRTLYKAGLLRRVTHICSVSGGSILAAHLVLNWGKYTSSDENDFAGIASEVVAFTAKDIRGRVLRRWLVSMLTLVRLLQRTKWNRTRILQAYYDDLYHQAKLKDLRICLDPSATAPDLHILATSLTTGNLCSFSGGGFSLESESTSEGISAARIPVALAVAASSAFPPLFPPVNLTRDDLHESADAFSHVEFLTDGGVFDNLGIRKLLSLQKQHGASFDTVILSDAGGAFDWALDKRFDFIVPRTVRASDLLMKRVGDLEYASTEAAFASNGTILVNCGLKTIVPQSEDLSVWDPETQRDCHRVRTDLDTFSPVEINTLINQGSAVARHSLRQLEGFDPDLVPATDSSWLPSWVKDSLGKEQVTNPDLTASTKTRVRLFNYHDWVSWLTVIVLGVYACVICLPFACEVYRARQGKEALKRQGEYSRLCTLAGKVASADTPEKAESVFAELTQEPTYRLVETEGIKQQEQKLGRTISAWRDGREGPDKVKHAALDVAHACRDAWNADKVEGVKDAVAQWRAVLYRRASETSKRIANSDSLLECKKDRKAFEELYWGELAMVENEKVEQAMIHFREALVKWTNPERGTAPEELKGLATVLEGACVNDLGELKWYLPDEQ